MNKHLLSTKLDRRRLLRNAGIIGMGATLAACSSALSPADADLELQQRRGLNANLDADILNFALNLEYLEAAYYLAAVDKLGMLPGGDAAIILPENPVVPFNESDPSIMEYAVEIALDELAHVNFLRAALGARAVARPVLDLRDSFVAAGNAIGVSGFNPFANEVFFLLGAFIFEDVGVTAYKGAAKFLQNKAFLRAAAGILGTEAYHAGEIRTVLYAIDAQDSTAGIAGLVKAISDVRDTLDGNGDEDQGIVDDNPFGTIANIVPADANALAFSRSTQQVLNIVYLDAAVGARRGGFFPEGLNGQFNVAVPSLV